MAAPAPSVRERRECYLARDAFYACMVNNGEQAEACGTQKRTYNSKCLPSWVKYFDQKRVYEEYKKKLKTAGYEQLPTGKEEQ